MRQDEARAILKKYINVAKADPAKPDLRKKVLRLIQAIRGKNDFLGYGGAWKVTQDIAAEVHTEIATHIDDLVHGDDTVVELNTQARIGAKMIGGKPFIIFSTGGDKGNEAEGLVFILYLCMLIGNIRGIVQCSTCGKYIIQSGQIKLTCSDKCRVEKSRFQKNLKVKK